MEIILLLFVSVTLFLLGAIWFKLSNSIKNNETVPPLINKIAEALGRVGTYPEALSSLEKRLSKSLEDYEKTLDPLASGMGDLLNYFGGIKMTAGKVGELTFDLIIQDLPESNIVRDANIEDGGMVEFVIKIGGDWVPIDSKCTTNVKTYVKSEVPKVAGYFGKRLMPRRQEKNSALFQSDIFTSSYGLIFVPNQKAYDEAISDKNLRSLMFKHRVWITSPDMFGWHLNLLSWISSESDRASDVTGLMRDVQKAISILGESVRGMGVLERHMESAGKNSEQIRQQLHSVINLLEGQKNQVKSNDETENNEKKIA